MEPKPVFLHPGRVFIRETRFDLPQQLSELPAYIRHYIDFLFQLTGVSPSPPVDLNAMYDRLGICVQMKDLGARQRGLLLPELGVVTINSADSRVRRRFTAAHELMEFFFDALESCELAPEFRATCEEAKAKERLCEEGGAAIVMPRSSIDTLLEHCPVRFEMVDDVARCFEVSYTAALHRIVRCSPEEKLLIVAERSTSRRQQLLFESGQMPLGLDGVPARPEPILRVAYTVWSRQMSGWFVRRNTAIPKESLIFAALTENRYVSGRERLRLGGSFCGRFDVTARPWRLGSRMKVLALVDIAVLSKRTGQLAVPFDAVSDQV